MGICQLGAFVKAYINGKTWGYRMEKGMDKFE